MDNKKKNIILIVTLSFFIILSICLSSYIIYDKLNNSNEESENNKIEEIQTPEESNDDELDNIQEDDITYQTKFPDFNEPFEKAMFIYSWFFDNSTLLKYVDTNYEVEENYYLLMIDGIKTIDDMANYAYDVFDKEFIDKKFNQVKLSETPTFKNHEKGVIVELGFVSQYSYDMGFSTYQKIEKTNGTTVYKAQIKTSIMDDEYGCDITHEYIAQKNSEGKLIFKTFEVPTTICLNDANTK